jgi:transposase-like protein
VTSYITKEISKPDSVQTCIVHRLRHSLDFVSYKDRKAVAASAKGLLPRQRRGQRRS